jgi:uncharacterized glyoxalase superfamily metalloenzyme YdcJ
MPPAPTTPSSSAAPQGASNSNFADKIDMQNRLFAELSAMFGREVPLYDKALLVNVHCNAAACDLYAKMFTGFAITPVQINRTGGERHGAIRIGKPEEYRLIGRFFAAFAMEPHNFFDMSNVGAKSQPVIATAFRSRTNPEHRVFTSLLQTDYFDPTTKARIDALLATRQVFSPAAIALLDKNERQGGLDWADANALITEGCESIFKWKGTARDYQLYKDLCDAGFKIAADIACFDSHHLNHLTPNTFCMDLYTAAMKFCMGELPEADFRKRAMKALTRQRARTDADALRLLFRHLTADAIAHFTHVTPPMDTVPKIVDALIAKLKSPELDLTKLKHAGFKDTTEGPSEDTPVLLRQDAYRALTEPVVFRNSDGTTLNATHTARFGEIEQRGYACTTKGRALYDTCLAEATALITAEEKKDTSTPKLSLAKRDPAAYEAIYERPFAAFPKNLHDLLQQGLVHGTFAPTAKGLAARGTIKPTDPSITPDVFELIHLGFVRVEGLRYEDFLPVSAAGIFASNLNQYGTKSTAAVKPTYTQAMLEAILGRSIIDSAKQYAAIEAASLVETYMALGLMPKDEWVEMAKG